MNTESTINNIISKLTESLSPTSLILFLGLILLSLVIRNLWKTLADNTDKYSKQIESTNRFFIDNLKEQTQAVNNLSHAIELFRVEVSSQLRSTTRSKS